MTFAGIIFTVIKSLFFEIFLFILLKYFDIQD
jgi:hypothetical protein